MENRRLSIEKSEEMYFGCLVDHEDRLVASSFGSNSALVEKHLIEYSAKTMGKSPTRGNHWLSKEMIRRFEGSETSPSIKPKFVASLRGFQMARSQPMD